jgi:phosphate-selective porin OprO/OprP
MVRVGNNFQVNNILDTGTIFSRDAQQIANLEFASACGPWTFSAEAATSWVTNAFTGGLPPLTGAIPKSTVAQGTYAAEAAYVELLYFLTPDHREYRKERPGHDRVAPRENFFFVDGDHGPLWGRGAWEIGVRYDYLDLTDGGVNGGIGQAVTFAVNWYFNPNARFQWNYFVMHRGFNPADAAARASGDLQGLGFRVNMDF